MAETANFYRELEGFVFEATWSGQPFDWYPCTDSFAIKALSEYPNLEHLVRQMKGGTQIEGSWYRNDLIDGKIDSVKVTVWLRLTAT